ncbi:AAA family ATPase [Massilia sp. GCM10020059]|uniref:AAA family ATPase n=1 Tax=Massilia agrisoli TaxID=2892444 RepID=A0ABS8IS10_9BURK|nr:AAA family ATPase [Massilia agrisoli]MCC6071437.1 AAA family ATPase [Massilia agrisoli]
MQDRSTPGIIVYGPSGCGKTTHAVALAAHFGKSRIVDDWAPGGRVGDDTLALTNFPHADSISFVDAASDAGIKLSPRRVVAIRSLSKSM